MKVKVVKDRCISCGACVALANNLFEFDEDNLSTPIKEEISDEEKDLANDAAETCPTSAIEIED